MHVLDTKCDTDVRRDPGAACTGHWPGSPWSAAVVCRLVGEFGQARTLAMLLASQACP